MSENTKLSNDYLALLFFQDHTDSPEINYLLCDSLIFKYNAGIYELLDEKQYLQREVLKFIRGLKDKKKISAAQNITNALIKDVIATLKLTITNTVDKIQADFIALQDDTLIDLSTTPFSLKPYHRDRVAFMKLDLTSESMKDATPPTKFFKFLSETLVKPDGKTPDRELIDFMQELFGYCLLDKTDAEAAFFLYGSGANGKTVLLDILKAMFPRHLLSASSLESLTTSAFRLSSLIGKKLNIVNEEESRYIKSDVFKNLVTGGDVTVDRKYLDSITTPLNIKLIFATNNLPTFSGVDTAMRRRLKIIPFHAFVPSEKRDPALAQTIIDEELSSIIVWALEGAQRLISRRYQFTTPQSMQEIMKEFEATQSSALDFFAENFVITPNSDDLYMKTRLFEAYKEWSLHTNRKAMTRNSFFRDLKSRYEQDSNLGFPENSTYFPPTKRSAHCLTNLSPTTDEAAWINEGGRRFSLLADDPSPSPVYTNS